MECESGVSPAAKRFFVGRVVSHGTGFQGNGHGTNFSEFKECLDNDLSSYGSVFDSPERSKGLESMAFMSPFIIESLEFILRFCVSAGPSRTTDPMCGTGFY